MTQCATYNDAVVPGENGELSELCDKVPTSGDVTSYEDAEREDRERVHVLARACPDPMLSQWRWYFAAVVRQTS